MATKLQLITQIIDKLAPKALAESWDNVGLQVGSLQAEVSKVLVALDINEEVIDEAKHLGVEAIICHHPLIFKPLKQLNFDSAQGRLLQQLIANGINVYAAHTNLDSARQGVNQTLAEVLGLVDIEVLSPDFAEGLVKLAVYVPSTHLDQVTQALFAVGAGHIGNYSCCSFRTEGVGTYKPEAGSQPFLGTVGSLEEVAEVKLETVLRGKDVNRAVKAMLKAHPYEEVAYDLYALANHGESLGLGRIGKLNEPVSLASFIELVKAKLQINHVTYGGDERVMVKKIAVCGGSGTSLMHKALFAGADLLLTGDIKYHEAQDMLARGLAFIDAGHNATERLIVPVVAQALRVELALAKSNVEVCESSVNTNPFKYSKG